MVDFEKVLEESRRIDSELKEVIGESFPHAKKLMIAVGRWFNNVNLMRRTEMKQRLEEWLEENQAL